MRKWTGISTVTIVLRDTRYGKWDAAVLDTTFAVDGATPQDFEAQVQRLCLEASSLARKGHAIIILSDRAAGSGRIAVPSLLAASAVNNHLVKTLQRTACALVVDCADAPKMPCLLAFTFRGISPRVAPLT